MSDTKSDVMHNATAYRDELRSELEKVERFIAMAERLGLPEESPGPDLALFTRTDPPPALH